MAANACRPAGVGQTSNSSPTTFGSLNNDGDLNSGNEPRRLSFFATNTFESIGDLIGMFFGACACNGTNAGFFR